MLFGGVINFGWISGCGGKAERKQKIRNPFPCMCVAVTDDCCATDSSDDSNNNIKNKDRSVS